MPAKNITRYIHNSIKIVDSYFIMNINTESMKFNYFLPIYKKISFDEFICDNFKNINLDRQEWEEFLFQKEIIFKEYTRNDYRELF